jgi:NAD(P)-dependent dehydrogenase (short-subunit alcohol dehydrogenase family)
MSLKKRILEHLLEQDAKPTPKMVQREYKSLAAKREIEQTLDQIAQAGGQAEYLSVDITDTDAVAKHLAAVELRLGKINMLVHGAGNLADKPIEKKTVEDFDLVYAPKVKGLENLLNCINPSQLDCLVLFSSVVGFYGNAGQTDYAIANDILNKTAYVIKQKYPQCHTVAINWGPWDSGMVSPELKRAFTERKIKTIPIAAGTQMLVAEVAPDNQQVQVVIGSPLKPLAIAVPPQPKTYQIQRCLSLAANPFLHDHVIMARPVLPATCAISWIVNTCEQLYPGYTFFSCINFKVLKGIVFDANLADKYLLDLAKKADEQAQNLTFEAKIWSKDKAGKTRYHFSSQVAVTSKTNNTPQYNNLDLSRQELAYLQPDSLYQNGAESLFHGACFQGVNTVLNVNKHKLTAECFLPKLNNIQQGQFPVQTFNPYLADVQIHTLWLWLQHNHQEICLPSEIITYRQFSIVNFDQIFYVSCEIKNKTKTYVVADIIAHDQDGKIYSQMLGAKGTIFSF